jgi:hypothetical protein
MLRGKPKVWPAIAGLLWIVLPAASASAQSTNAAPILTYNAAAFDASKLSVLTDAAKQALTAAAAQLQSGDLLAYVFTASPDGKMWSLNSVAKSTPIFSLADSARSSLETCEYTYKSPCTILTINGHDTQKPGGGWDLQPVMLFKRAADFDAARVPFVLASDRNLLRGYASVSGNRALIITTAGGWLYRSGDTIQMAIDTAESDCATSFTNQTCLLYAVNDRVVFEP